MKKGFWFILITRFWFTFFKSKDFDKIMSFSLSDYSITCKNWFLSTLEFSFGSTCFQVFELRNWSDSFIYQFGTCKTILIHLRIFILIHSLSSNRIYLRKSSTSIINQFLYRLLRLRLQVSKTYLIHLRNFHFDPLWLNFA